MENARWQRSVHVRGFFHANTGGNTAGFGDTREIGVVLAPSVR